MTDPNSVMTSVSTALLKLKSNLKYKVVVLTAALSVMMENWTQLKWLTTEKWAKDGYINTTKYCVVLKENGIDQPEITEQEGKVKLQESRV